MKRSWARVRRPAAKGFTRHLHRQVAQASAHLVCGGGGRRPSSAIFGRRHGDGRRQRHHILSAMDAPAICQRPNRNTSAWLSPQTSKATTPHGQGSVWHCLHPGIFRRRVSRKRYSGGSRTKVTQTAVDLVRHRQPRSGYRPIIRPWYLCRIRLPRGQRRVQCRGVVEAETGDILARGASTPTTCTVTGVDGPQPGARLNNSGESNGFH